LVLPVLVAKCTAGPRPLNMFLGVYVYRTIVAIPAAALVYWTPSLRDESGQFSYLFYGLWLGMFCIYH
ncbi:gland protein G8A07, partial [Aphelenchoides avenae]